MKKHEAAIKEFRKICVEAEAEEARAMQPAREVRRITVDSANSALARILREPDKEVDS